MAGAGDLLGLAAFLTSTAAAVEEAQHRALETGAKIVETEAKRVLGTHDYGWPPLQADTIARKSRGDTPLLETGEMRDSIGHKVLNRHEALIGATSDHARFQELGTSKIPPRPFLRGAAERKVPELQAALGRGAVAALEKER